jgi:hypothetical protein
VVTGAVEASDASSETPVALAKPEPSTADVATPGATLSPSASPEASAPASSGPDESKAGIDAPATDPLGTLTPEEQSKSMPMAGHGNNHSSPSLEQGAKD